ncbi:MAG: hypothetical protein KDJ41_16870 [Hyphomicrobiaceae bacterium]|nr:hypothetical protein [Hyphomicrobiaceae bacterium]
MLRTIVLLILLAAIAALASIVLWVFAPIVIPVVLVTAGIGVLVVLINLLKRAVLRRFPDRAGKVTDQGEPKQTPGL